MKIEQIAKRLHDLMVNADAETAYNELFSENAVAIEPKFPGMERVEGLSNIRKKVQAMIEGIDEVKHREVSPDIVIGENHFAINIAMDAVLKNGQNFKVDEICLYTVEEGKIISEKFFY